LTPGALAPEAVAVVRWRGRCAMTEEEWEACGDPRPMLEQDPRPLKAAQQSP